MRKVIGEYVLLNNGYNNKIYKGGKLIKEFRDTSVGAIEFVRKISKVV